VNGGLVCSDVAYGSPHLTGKVSGWARFRLNSDAVSGVHVAFGALSGGDPRWYLSHHFNSNYISTLVDNGPISRSGNVAPLLLREHGFVWLDMIVSIDFEKDAHWTSCLFGFGSATLGGVLQEEIDLGPLHVWASGLGGGTPIVGCQCEWFAFWDDYALSPQEHFEIINFQAPSVPVLTLPDGLTAVHEAIHDWITLATGLDADRIVWTQQGGPRPPGAGPWISLELSSIDQHGMNWESQSEDVAGESIIFKSQGIDVAALSVQCFGGDATGASSSMAIGHRIVKSRDLPSVDSLLHNAGIGVLSFGPVIPVSGVRNTTVFEPRAALEVTLTLPSEASESTAIVDSVEVTLTEPVDTTFTVEIDE
jgi:hypothetical protein